MNWQNALRCTLILLVATAVPGLSSTAIAQPDYYSALLSRWQSSTLELDRLHESLRDAERGRDDAIRRLDSAGQRGDLLEMSAIRFQLVDLDNRVDQLGLHIAQLNKHRDLLRREVNAGRLDARKRDAAAAMDRADERRARDKGMTLAQMRKQEKETEDRLLANLMLLVDLLTSPTPAAQNTPGTQVAPSPASGNGSRPGSSGTIIKADPAAAFGLSSTAPSRVGTNSLCPGVDPWSLSAAAGFVGAAETAKIGFTGDCRGANWSTCQTISDNLHKARDHIFQVFDQNHDGIANCRFCNYDAVIAAAKGLIAQENWLTSRYFYGAGGLSTIYYTINDNATDPLCKIPAQTTVAAAGGNAGAGATGATGGSGSSAAAGSGSSTAAAAMHPCNDPSIPVDARWKFYRYIYGGGGTAYVEKAGLICYTDTSYYTYKGQMEKFVCESADMQDCGSDGSPPTTYTEVKTEGGGTRYEYEGGYAVRSPDGAAADAPRKADPIAVAIQACNKPDIESGREWLFAGNFGYSKYYEHDGHLCATSTDTAMRIDGDRLVGYRCNANWKSCAAANTYDADILPDKSEIYEMAGKRYRQLQVKWRGMQPRVLLVPE